MQACMHLTAALQDYIAVKTTDAVYLPHTAGRYQMKRFRKAQVSSLASVDLPGRRHALQNCGFLTPIIFSALLSSVWSTA